MCPQHSTQVPVFVSRDITDVLSMPKKRNRVAVVWILRFCHNFQFITHLDSPAVFHSLMILKPRNANAVEHDSFLRRFRTKNQ